jgi:CRP/FNR family transcriptional regulator
MVPAQAFCDVRGESEARELIAPLSTEMRDELASLRVISDCPSGMILFHEQEMPSLILFLMEGQVRLSMNSSTGKRLTLGIADPGDTLGLAPSLSGMQYDTTAETVCPCRIASLGREKYLSFLMRHPSAYKNALLELCQDRARGYDQLRAIGLMATAPVKLARLLLEWCDEGQKTDKGTRLSCAFTHGEIGEFIGTSRETVTRIFRDLKYRELLEARGSTLIISDRRALEVYAGLEN